MECRWLQRLSETPEVTEVPEFSADAISLLDQLSNNFSVSDAQDVKKVGHQDYSTTIK